MVGWDIEEMGARHGDDDDFDCVWRRCGCARDFRFSFVVLYLDGVF